jgi:type II secretory pathway pseudopilin PulG
MKFFSKSELVSIIVIFLILIVVSAPNFALSLRRARDQIRRDDIGNIQAAIDSYYSDYGMFPISDNEGRIVACRDMVNKLEISQRPCVWGTDTWVNLTPGVDKVYMRVLPGDPYAKKGISYVYFSDGSRYQLFGSLESIDEPGYDEKLAAREVKCGNKVCNVGRAVNVPMYTTIEEYNLQIYCGQHPKDIKCL